MTFQEIAEVVNQLPEGNSIFRLLEQLKIIIDFDHLALKDGYSYKGNIILKASLDFQYRQFVIAHELGHTLLHENYFLLNFSPDVESTIEKEANIFACLLLQKFGYDCCIPQDIKSILCLDYGT